MSAEFARDEYPTFLHFAEAVAAAHLLSRVTPRLYEELFSNMELESDVDPREFGVFHFAHEAQRAMPDGLGKRLMAKRLERVWNLGLDDSMPN